MTSAKNKNVPYGTIVICATILGLAVVVGLVVIVLFAPPDTDLVKLLGAIGTGIALIASQVATYLKTRSIGGTVDELANGKMDAKIRAGVADVVKPDLIDASAHSQLAEDRRARDGSAA